MRTKLIIAFVAIAFSADSQNTWVQKADFGGGLRRHSFTFSIGGKAYMGTGQDQAYNGTSDFWEYDPVNNLWTQKGNAPGNPRIGAACFTLGSKGYMCMGYTNALDLWEYDAVGNTWTQKANFGGVSRWAFSSFSIGNKGYIAMGMDWGNSFNMSDLWQYNPVTNSWVQRANFGGTARRGAPAFGIGGKAYLGTGYTSTGTIDFWEYDTLSNSWSQKINFPGTARYGAACFVLNGRGYVGCGSGPGQDGGLMADFWEYNPSNNSWIQRANFGGLPREAPTAFVVNGKAYVGNGEINYNNTWSKDFWEYTPPSFITITPASTNVKCAGGSDGSAAVSASSGTTPYTYSWNPTGATTASVTGLTAGSYTCTVTDAGGITQTQTFSISQPGALFVSTSTVGNSATANVIGGVTPYTYSWSPGGQTTQTATNLTSSSYTVTVTDANGCTQVAVVSFVGIAEKGTGKLSIHPNPFTSQATIMFAEEMKDASLVLYNLEGKEVRNLRFSGKQVILDRTGLADGAYFCKVLSQDGSLIALQKLVVR